MDFVADKLRLKPLRINAKRGTIERAMQQFHTHFPEIPVLVSKNIKKEIIVFNRDGYGINNIHIDTDPEYYDIIDSNKYIECLGTGDIDTGSDTSCITINLKANFGRSTFVKEFSENSYNLAFSDHADFNETLDYILKSGAKLVYTDSSNVRSGLKKAKKLSEAIIKKLGIKSKPLPIKDSNNWGE